MFSSKKVIEVGNLYKTLSKEAISKRLGIDIESVSRYIRAFKKGLPPEPVIKKPIRANVLLFDIETLFGVGRFWRVWKENINHWQVIKPGCLLSWSAKWLFEPEIFGDIMTKEEAIARDSERVTKSLWKYMEKADIIIAHNCLEKNTKVLTTELKWIPIKDLRVGDELVGFEEFSERKYKPRRILKSIVEENFIQKQKCFKVCFDDGTSIIATPDHKWLKLSANGRDYRWCETLKLKIGQRVEKFTDVWEENKSYEAGWLSGFLSGEGTFKKGTKNGAKANSIQFCQRPGKTLNQAIDFCNKLGIQLSIGRNNTGGLGRQDCLYHEIYGGKWNSFKILGCLQVDRLINNIDWDYAGSLKSPYSKSLTITKIEDAGEREVSVMSTSTNTFIAEGLLMHNCRAFDILRVNTQFLLHGLGQPAPYKVIDTCLVARKYFAFEHNTLDSLAERLGIPGKLPTDNSLWVDCDSGDKKALKKMFEYNKNDVRVLEEVYVKLRPWIKDHPNLALFHDVTENEGKPICRTCVSPNLTGIGEYMTSVNTYDSYRCNDCGAIHRARRANTSLKKDTHILQGIS